MIFVPAPVDRPALILKNSNENKVAFFTAFYVFFLFFAMIGMHIIHNFAEIIFLTI